MIRNKKTVIDLFCGCGGLSYGFTKAGYNVVLGIDHWQDAITTFNYNHKGTLGLVADLFVESVKNICQKTGIKKVDVIIGGPPCQGFSIAGKRIIDDERNKLYKSFVDFVKFYMPQIFLMENVPNIVSMGGGLIKDAIIQDFEKLGYKVTYKVLMASEFGVPQNRKRAFFIGIKGKKEFNYNDLAPEKLITVGEAISDLPESSLPDGHILITKPKSKFQSLIRQGAERIYNHEITQHSKQTTQIISMVPDGGNYKNLPKNLQGIRNVHIAWTRLNSKKPSFTIDTGHRHHFHYKFNRVPTVRESARIQSFPDSFLFFGSKSSQYKQVGNAVPPILANAIAEQLKKYL